MKPIHKAAGKSQVNREWRAFIQVKEGVVNACDGCMLVRLPISEVFPENLISPEEELYFLADDWAKAKMDKAVSIKRDGLLFYSYDKAGKKLGLIEALDRPEFRYPDVTVVLNDKANKKPVTQVGFDPYLLSNACAAFGAKEGFRFTFYGVNNGIQIHQFESKGEGLIMPCFLNEEKWAERENPETA